MSDFAVQFCAAMRFGQEQCCSKYSALWFKNRNLSILKIRNGLQNNFFDEKENKHILDKIVWSKLYPTAKYDYKIWDVNKS
jgi:hypothetical protein